MLSPSRTTGKDAVGPWKAPEVEAWRQVFLPVQPMELIDGFAVPHVPVQVAIPVDGDANHPTLQGTQVFKSWDLGTGKYLPWSSYLHSVKEGHFLV